MRAKKYLVKGNKQYIKENTSAIGWEWVYEPKNATHYTKDTALRRWYFFTNECKFKVNVVKVD